MKKLLSIITLAVIVFLTATPTFAQSTQPGDPGGDPTGEPPIGGGAPIGGGTLILLALGAAYGGKKVYALQKEEGQK